jgi:hypothetical protein
VVTVVEDEHGSPLDVGRKQRAVSTALKRATVAARFRAAIVSAISMPIICTIGSTAATRASRI